MSPCQLGLFEDAPEHKPHNEADVTCMFGRPSPSNPEYPESSGWHCAGCQQYGEELIAQFHADVAAGKYDAQGYTPNERRAQARRQVDAQLPQA